MTAPGNAGASRQVWSILARGLMLSALVSGCGGDDSDNVQPVSGNNTTAVITTVASDYSSGQVELVEFGSTLTASGGYHSTISDIAVSTHDDDYYLMERYQYDLISKVDLDNPSIFQWRHGAVAAGSTSSANPYGLIFVSDSKAYLLRYGTEKAWIVDPTAQNQANFKIGELDLSSYTPSDGNVPGMSAGLVHDGKVYITLQRLDSSYAPVNTSCVAVFNVSDNSEVDTGQGGSECGKGIALEGRNPGEIIHHPDVGILVQNTGQNYPSIDTTHSSIDHIDPSTYVATKRVDAIPETGLTSNIAVVSASQGYFLGYDGFGSLDLRSFDPSDGSVDSGAVAGMQAVDLRDVTLGPNGRVWVADATASDPGLQLLDPSDDSKLTFVPTTMPPNGIGFTNIQ